MRYHSGPPYVGGDLLAELDDSSIQWFFAGSRFTALMDERFDYKHERQANPSRIRKDRWNAITF